MSPEDTLQKYQLLHSARKLLERHGVWHVAAGGTLLGAVRNKGIVPHDNDMDLVFIRDEFNVSAALKADLEKNRLQIHDHLGPDFKRITMMDLPGFRVDLFGWVKQGDKLHWPNYPNLTSEWPASIAEEGGLIQWPFGSTTVPAPPRKISEAFLTHEYGPDWRTEISCKGTRHDCFAVQDVEYDLTGRALPDSPLEDPM